MTQGSKSVNSVIQELLPILRRLVHGRHAIALGGSLAKGMGDEHSDIDFYLFADDALAIEERREILRQSLPAPRWLAVACDLRTCSWGTVNDFDFRGQRVETTIRAVDRIEATIAECQGGIERCEPTGWTAYGFYNHVLLSDLTSAAPLEDPDGLLARWQEQLAVYPSKLRQTIVKQHLSQAKIWPANPHYTSAVLRQDVIYTAGIVHSTLHHLILVLFALNQAYYPGDKKLLAAVQKLALVPQDFAAQADRLAGEGRQMLQDGSQQRVLQELVAGVECLVRTQMPESAS